MGWSPPPVRFLNDLKTAENDVVGATTIVKYAQTEAFLEFPDMPYLLAQSTVAVRQEDPLQEIRTVDDLQGYRIGGMAGDELPAPFDQLQIEPLSGERWVQQNLQKLIAGRIDAVFSRDASTFPFDAARLELGTKIKLLPLPAPPTRLYVSSRKATPQSKRLVEQYNAAVNALQLNFEELFDKELAAAASK